MDEAIPGGISVISWIISTDSLIFTFSHESNPITVSSPVSSWIHPPEGEGGGGLDPQIDLLRELLDNGRAIVDETSIRIPHEEICALHEIDCQLLGLPSPYPFEIRINSDGTLNQSDFTYKWGFYEYAGGNRFSATRQGSILTMESGEQYRLSSAQLNLCNALDEFNALLPKTKTLEENLIRFAAIKQIAEDAGAAIDAYLQDQVVVNPDKISLKIRAGNDDNSTLEILPEIADVDAEQFEKKFDRFPTVQGVYTLEAADGVRTRVTFTKHQQEELKKVKLYRRVRGERRDQILDAPQQIFNPDTIALDSFSQRVKEIGIYRPTFIPFISPYRSKWLPGRNEYQADPEWIFGVLIEEPATGDRQKVLFETPEEFDEFIRSIDAAKEYGQQSSEKSIEWKGKRISIPDAEKIREAARISSHALRESDPTNTEKIRESKSPVLIIKENIEDLEYSESAESTKLPEEHSLCRQFEAPPNLKGTVQLYDHQKEGLIWLQSLLNGPGCSKGYSGALLADDMGLGKTLQVLGFLEWHNAFCNTANKPYLIVAPLTLLDNWEAEYPAFFDPCSLPLIRLHGGAHACRMKANDLNRRLIVLTTYETLRGRSQFDLCPIDWAVAILDEAQRVKTPGTLVTNAAKALKADFKIALSGTPVENTLVDLWCITDFLVPGLLGSLKDFACEFQNPLKQEDIDVKELGDRLRSRIGLYLKRRLKTDVLKDLPAKYIHPLKQQMPEVQLRRYEMEISQIKPDHELKGDGRIEDARKGDVKKGILSILHTLRDICDHPFLPDQQIDAIGCDRLIDSSAKLKATVDVIDDIRDRGEKVILFADRRKTQHMLAKVLKEKFGLMPSIINGDTPVARQSQTMARETRQQAIDRFQKKPGFNAIVISQLAAGVGLNITAANHVIHYSRHWNPAKEDQATDRVYRIGQDKEVHIYLPMAIASFKSFDIVLDELLEAKRSLAKASLFPTQRAEVNPDDVYNAVIGGEAYVASSVQLSLADIDTLEPFLFESAVAALWQKMGYRVEVTPQINDQGADVVAVSEGKNMLIHVKQSKLTISDAPIGEVLKAKGFFEKKYQTSFVPIVVTNSLFTTNAIDRAASNGVGLLDRQSLTTYIENHPLLLSDVWNLERKRLQSL